MKLKLCILYCLALTINIMYPFDDAIDTTMYEDYINSLHSEQNTVSNPILQDKIPSILPTPNNQPYKSTSPMTKITDIARGTGNLLSQAMKTSDPELKKLENQLNEEYAQLLPKKRSFWGSESNNDQNKKQQQELLDIKKQILNTFKEQNQFMNPETEKSIREAQSVFKNITTKEQATALLEKNKDLLRTLRNSNDIFSNAWNYTKEKASDIKNSVIDQAKDIKSFAESHPWLFAIATTTAAVTGSGIINRLANLAGWKYAKFRDYPHAKPGTYQIIITFEHTATERVLENPSILLNFTNNQTIQAKNTIAIYNVDTLNEKFKNTIGNGSITDILPRILLEIQNNTFNNDSSIQMRIDVGLEDQSGFFGTQIGSSFHSANRRWLKPIITTIPATFKNDNDAIKYVADLFVAQLKDRISCAKSPIPRLKTMNDPNNDEFLKQNYACLKQNYDINNPTLHVSDKNGYVVATGTWDMIQNDVAQYTENYPKLAQYNIALEFLPKDNTLPNTDMQLENSFYYLNNIKYDDIENAIQLN